MAFDGQIRVMHQSVNVTIRKKSLQTSILNFKLEQGHI